MLVLWGGVGPSRRTGRGARCGRRAPVGRPSPLGPDVLLVEVHNAVARDLATLSSQGGEAVAGQLALYQRFAEPRQGRGRDEGGALEQLRLDVPREPPSAA